MSGKNRGVNALAWLLFILIILGLAGAAAWHFGLFAMIGGLP
jgi:hypothetical protein